VDEQACMRVREGDDLGCASLHIDVLLPPVSTYEQNRAEDGQALSS
jgi:hypothetical protein